MKNIVFFLIFLVPLILSVNKNDHNIIQDLKNDNYIYKELQNCLFRKCR